MGKIVWNSTEEISPVWAGDDIDRLNVLPGGALLNISSIPTNTEGKKYIQSGTLLGRTFTERAAGTGFGIADVATDEEIYLLMFDVQDAADNDEIELYRHNRLVYENSLPGWAAMPAAQKTWIRANYECIVV